MRPEILFPLFAPITSLKGVGPRVAPLLERLAGPIVRDVAFLKPHSLIRRSPASLSQALGGEVMTFEVTVEEVAGNPGYNTSKFFLRPHFQLEGLTVSLRLVTKLPSVKAGGA